MTLAVRHEKVRARINAFINSTEGPQENCTASQFGNASLDSRAESSFFQISRDFGELGQSSLEVFDDVGGDVVGIDTLISAF